MVAQIIGTSSPSEPLCQSQAPATQLGPSQRKGLSIQVLGHTEPVSRLAEQHAVSRKFLYQQAEKASDALDDAFAPAVKQDDVLFHLPVTKSWIQQFVLALVLIGHSSFRGVQEILDAVFDYRQISLGKVHNIVNHAVAQARVVNDVQDLSTIRVGAHDEIFQAGQPVLVGADVQSTYCYLLAAEDHRDETTWGVHLLNLTDQGLGLDYTIADGGTGLRAGQAAAWAHIPCHGDVFHAEWELGKLALFLENRAAGCISAVETLERKMQRSKKRGKGQSLSKKLALARQAQAQAIDLAQDVRILVDWTQNDILSLAGPDRATRRELLDFVIDELAQREPLCAHRIRPVRRMLQRHRDPLLAFAGILDDRFANIARQRKIPLSLVSAVCQLQALDQNCSVYWQRRADLYEKLGPAFADIEVAVRQVMAQTPRASSIVENLNSRLRDYFFLRRHIGNGYLDLLRFFLNHHRFLRSDRDERVGKSPAELLDGQAHPHWLELLGYERFHRN